MAVVIRNLSKRFDGRQVLAGLSAELPDSGVVAVEGPSGAGKTTFLNILMGLTPRDAGLIQGLEGRRFSAVFQENRLLENWSVARNIRLVCDRSVTDADIRAQLDEVGLGGEEKTPVRLLSGGMKRRVALVRAVIAPEWDILTLDEPFKGLDEATRGAAVRYVLRRAAGRLILLVTHDRDEARAMGACMTITIGGDNA